MYSRFVETSAKILHVAISQFSRGIATWILAVGYLHMLQDISKNKLF